MWGSGYLFVVLKMGERKRSVAEAGTADREALGKSF